MKHIKIALIEDEPLGLDLMERLLKRSFGYELDLIKCSDPLSSIPIILAQRPQLIILDLRLPHISGLDFIKMLEHTGAAFLLVTAGDISTEELNANVMLLNKPYSPEEFKYSVHKLLNISFQEKI